MKHRIQSDLVRQRLFLIRLAKQKGVSKACLELGKHRSYFYYWNNRFVKFGTTGLRDHKKIPKRMPKLTPKKIVDIVIKLRRQTNYGKERIYDLLIDRGIKLAVSTIGKILKRAGLLIKKRLFATQKKHTRCYNLLYPGQRLQMDIKHVPSEINPDGRKFYQYTIIDECTRMRYLAWHDSIWTKKVVQTLREALVYFGFKADAVQTDNGIEFTFKYTAELHAFRKEPKVHPLDKFCEAQKLKHRLIPPGEKELNGKVERSHRTDDEEFYRTITNRVKNIEELREKGQRWLEDYNYKRRHSAIGKLTPGQFALQRLKLFPERILVA